MFANQASQTEKAAFTFVKNGNDLRLVNPDHRMTDQQERLSQRGISFVESEADLAKDHPQLEGYDNDDVNQKLI